MDKNYLYIFILSLCFFALTPNIGYAQIGSPSVTSKSTENVEGLVLYPNPVTDGRIYIESRANTTKEISLYNVVGKKVFATTLTSKELVLPYNVSPGVYIINIKEKEAISTRKIIVK